MKFFKGLHKDNHPVDQPDQTYRDGRNVVFKERRGAISNEPGTQGTSLLPSGYVPIGRCNLPDERIVVFLAGDGGESEIGIIGTDGKYQTLVNDSRLNFDKEYPIQAVARISVARTISQQFADPSETSITEDALNISEHVSLTIS